MVMSGWPQRAHSGERGGGAVPLGGRAEARCAAAVASGREREYNLQEPPNLHRTDLDRGREAWKWRARPTGDGGRATPATEEGALLFFCVQRRWGRRVEGHNSGRDGGGAVLAR